jgi:hypothetical protein
MGSNGAPLCFVNSLIISQTVVLAPLQPQEDKANVLQKKFTAG